MKRNFILFACLLCVCTNLVKAAETEPNNTKAQANTLTLNGSNSGKINPAGDVDWYKVTTNADGRLDLTLTALSGKPTYMYLFDNNGTIQLNAQYTSGTLTMSTDGLAAGTYFVKVNCYYSSDTSSYTISNALVKPAQANDTEPNDSRSVALTLGLNSSTTGHIGYYFNNLRDTFDWYKVTTTGDGRLRLRITSFNGQNVWAYLFDNDGTTQLNAQYTSSTTDINTDGLAAGTYYVRVNNYYVNSEYAPYKLEDSLFVPAQANNVEPDSTRALAKVLPLNSGNTGHIGYYFNHLRDTFDWYKVTLPKDGLLRLRITSYNGQNVWAYLFDNDGTTQLAANYTSSSVDINKDGLAAGTYYIRVNNYYVNSEFAPYKLEDSLFAYANAADSESNAIPHLAQTLPANVATPGHIGFYYKNTRDTIDWWKINYTGSGALSVTLNVEPTKLNGGDYTWLEVYKDTNAAALYSQYTTTSLTASLTGLAQSYYWVRVHEYYSSSFESYTLTPTFTQVNKAKIKLVSSLSAPDCSSTNSLTLKCSGSKPPYSVQLQRYGVAYGAVRKVPSTSAFTFSNLPSGVYSAKVYGDGATGAAFTKLALVTLAPTPASLTVTNITATQAKLNWNAQTCVSYYTVQYRKLGTNTWTAGNTNGPVSGFVAKPLTASTSYEWQVAPVDSSAGIIDTGAYSMLDTFTTAAALMAGAAERLITNENNKAVITTYPNPAATQFTVQLNAVEANGLGALWLKDLNGTTVWSKQQVILSGVKGMQVNVSNLAAGMYLLQITDKKNTIIAVKKIIVSR